MSFYLTRLSAAKKTYMGRLTCLRRLTIIREDLKAQNLPIAQVDPELSSILGSETKREASSINLIASENYPSRAVLEALSAPVTGGGEGYPGHRFYGGKRHVDEIELLCRRRALEAFRLDPNDWGVNVQPLSGALANVYVYSALMEVGDKVMGLEVAHGGHHSHGYKTAHQDVYKVVNRFESIQYHTEPATGMIDYDMLARRAFESKPKIIVAGSSSYSRTIDWTRLRAVADESSSILLADMSHIAGLVAADVIPSPFESSHIVTTTSLKTLRGPRAAMIFYRQEYGSRINEMVHPGFQSGANHRTITALAVALLQAKIPTFRAYQQRVLRNAQVLARTLIQLGHPILTGGTDTHLMVLDLRGGAVDAALLEQVLETIGVTCNRCVVPGDASGERPCGLRIGTAAMTTRGFDTAEFAYVGEVVHQAIELTSKINRDEGAGRVGNESLNTINHLGGKEHHALLRLRCQVTDLLKRFELVQAEEEETMPEQDEPKVRCRSAAEAFA